MIDIRWIYLFVDTPAPDAVTSWGFWSDVTGWSISPVRGELGQFATLIPPAGDPWVKLQAVDAGPGGLHLDLDVEDVERARDDAVDLGAIQIGALGDGVRIMRTPGGFVFCLTRWQGAKDQQRAGQAALIDQACLDLPDAVHDRDQEFWAALTGWPVAHSRLPEFSWLERPTRIPVRLLFQRLAEPDGTPRGHIDLACADRAEATAQHQAAGASVVERREFWTVMRDPVGRTHCLTDRAPQG